MYRQADTPKNIAGDETRTRLLEAATQVFLETGFRAARVQDIVQRAGMRLSAINYHFGSKEGLYLAVLQYHADVSLQTAVLDQARADKSPPRVRLESVIERTLQLHVGKDAITQVPKLLLRELSNPTPALEVIVKKFTLPMTAHIQELLGEILGPAVPRSVVNRAVFSLLGQCVMYSQARAIVEGVDPDIANDPDLIANTTRYITDFTWAGLQGLRQQWEAQQAS